MRIVWDELKRRGNIDKHRLDFATLEPQFFEQALIKPARGGRAVAIGWHGDVLIVAVVFRAMGSEAVSVISMRPASANERRLYGR